MVGLLCVELRSFGRFMRPSKVRQMCGRNTIGEFGSVLLRFIGGIPVAGLYI